MTRHFAAACIAGCLTLLFAGCAGTSRTLPAERNRHVASNVERPAPENPDPPPAGSAYVNTQCSASDPSCAGPWTSSASSYDDWETASPNGNGSFQQRVVCNSTASCAAMGRSGIDEEVVYSWVPSSGAAGGGSLTTDYQSACDPVFNDAFPDGCAPVTVAFQGKDAKPGQTCVGSPLAIGFPLAGNDTRNNDVVQIYAVRGLGLAAHVGGVAAYVYQTGAGSYWFQLNVSVSGGVGVVGASASTPYFGINGTSPDELTGAVNKAIPLMGLTTGTAPIQIAKTLNGNLQFSAVQCFQNSWNGTYTASAKRRV